MGGRGVQKHSKNSDIIYGWSLTQDVSRFLQNFVKIQDFLDCFSFQNANFHEGFDSFSQGFRNAGSDHRKNLF